MNPLLKNLDFDQDIHHEVNENSILSKELCWAIFQVRSMKNHLQSHGLWHMILRQCVVVIAALLFMLPMVAGSALATGVFDVPLVKAGSETWVIDQGNVLSVLNKGALEKKLSKLAETTGKEVRFVTIRRFDYEQTAKTVTDGVFERWFPTPAEQENQVLLLLDTQTNNTSIHTGDGVKPLLPDEIAKSVASETALAPIREGNYNQGLMDAANRLSIVLSGEPDPGPPEIKVVEVESTFKSAKETDDKSAGVIVIVLLLAATIIPMATYYWYQRG
jgi:uncharacterized protein